MAIIPIAWLFRNVRHVCIGDVGVRTMYLATVLSATAWLSKRSSDSIRGAPQVMFSRDIRRIRLRISSLIGGRPGLRVLDFQH